MAPRNYMAPPKPTKGAGGIGGALSNSLWPVVATAFAAFCSILLIMYVVSTKPRHVWTESLSLTTDECNQTTHFEPTCAGFTIIQEDPAGNTTLFQHHEGQETQITDRKCVKHPIDGYQVCWGLSASAVQTYFVWPLNPDYLIEEFGSNARLFYSPALQFLAGDQAAFETPYFYTHGHQVYLDTDIFTLVATTAAQIYANGGMEMHTPSLWILGQVCKIDAGTNIHLNTPDFLLSAGLAKTEASKIWLETPDFYSHGHAAVFDVDLLTQSATTAMQINAGGYLHIETPDFYSHGHAAVFDVDLLTLSATTTFLISNENVILGNHEARISQLYGVQPKDRIQFRTPLSMPDITFWANEMVHVYYDDVRYGAMPYSVSAMYNDGRFEAIWFPVWGAPPTLINRLLTYVYTDAEGGQWGNPLVDINKAQYKVHDNYLNPYQKRLEWFPGACGLAHSAEIRDACDPSPFFGSPTMLTYLSVTSGPGGTTTELKGPTVWITSNMGTTPFSVAPALGLTPLEEGSSSFRGQSLAFDGAPGGGVQLSVAITDTEPTEQKCTIQQVPVPGTNETTDEEVCVPLMSKDESTTPTVLAKVPGLSLTPRAAGSADVETTGEIKSDDFVVKFPTGADAAVSVEQSTQALGAMEVAAIQWTTAELAAHGQEQSAVVHTTVVRDVATKDAVGLGKVVPHLLKYIMALEARVAALEGA